MQDAAELGVDDDYWARAESDPWKTGLFLLQSQSLLAILSQFFD